MEEKSSLQLIDINIVNAYFMYRQCKEECYLNREQFRLRLAEELLSARTTTKKTP